MHITLPASANDHCGVKTVGRVQRPVVNDLGPLAVGGVEGLSVDEELHVGEAHIYGVVVPFVVTHLTKIVKNTLLPRSEIC